MDFLRTVPLPIYMGLVFVGLAVWVRDVWGIVIAVVLFGVGLAQAARADRDDSE